MIEDHPNWVPHLKSVGFKTPGFRRYTHKQSSCGLEVWDNPAGDVVWIATLREDLERSSDRQPAEDEASALSAADEWVNDQVSTS